MDATTPPEYARAICSSLENCRVVSIPALGHAPFDLENWQSGDCFDRIAVDFYQEADVSSVDIRCLAEMKPPPFHVESRATGGAPAPGSSPR